MVAVVMYLFFKSGSADYHRMDPKTHFLLSYETDYGKVWFTLMLGVGKLCSVMPITHIVVPLYMWLHSWSGHKIICP